jgi:hypothetical protein
MLTMETLVSAVDTNGAFELVAQHLPPFSDRRALDLLGTEYLCSYVLSGAIALSSEGATVMLRAGDLFLLRPRRSLVYWNPCVAPAQLLLIVASSRDGVLPRDRSTDIVLREPKACDTS